MLNFDDVDYCQGYSQIKETFRALTKDDILQPYIPDHDFRSSNKGDDNGYKLYVLDIRYQKNVASAQPIKVELKSSENLPAGIYSYALVLKIVLVSIGSDGQSNFDSFEV